MGGGATIGLEKPRGRHDKKGGKHGLWKSVPDGCVGSAWFCRMFHPPAEAECTCRLPRSAVATFGWGQNAHPGTGRLSELMPEPTGQPFRGWLCFFVCVQLDTNCGHTCDTYYGRKGGNPNIGGGVLTISLSSADCTSYHRCVRQPPSSPAYRPAWVGEVFVLGGKEPLLARSR